MSRIAIHADSIGKRYQIGERSSYLTLRDRLAGAAKFPARWFRSQTPGVPADEPRHIWALRDVSFDLNEGEILGIVGRNGAGKSTLLKILSRVTQPTQGVVEVHGRMGSLLEVGTGFHPELTGRENIFLNGAILGMRRSEIARKFEEIVAFAEVGKFVDTPVKHYSSGMYTRLAFSVAAHLEPNILIVDEVLSVGDTGFQKKCLGKMGEVAHAGRTVIFVSHNLTAVNTLCSRTILLDGGKIVMDGGTAAVLSTYHAQTVGMGDDGSDLRNKARAGNGKAVFRSVVIQPLGLNGECVSAFRTGDDLRIEVEIESRAELRDCFVAVIFYDRNGYRLVDMNTAMKADFLSLQAGERACVRFVARQVLLKPGTYTVQLWLGRDISAYVNEEVDSLTCAATLEIAPSSVHSKSTKMWPGPYLCQFESSVSSSKEIVTE